MGLLQRLAAWFEAHRGHLVTGTVSAAAALLVMVMIQGQNESEGEPTRVQLPPRLVPTMPAAHPVAESTEPEIESLEVYQGSGTILTLPGEGDEVSTQVIWLTPEDAEEKMEGPI